MGKSDAFKLSFLVLVLSENSIKGKHTLRKTVYVPQLSYPFICLWTSRFLWYIYTMEYYSATKKNTFESVLMRWMKLEPIIQSEVSQKEKHQYSILTHIYGI